MSSNAKPRMTVVVLKGRVLTSRAALELLWILEERGDDLRIQGNELVLTPNPRQPIYTGAQTKTIATYRRELTRLVRYVEEQGWQKGA